MVRQFFGTDPKVFQRTPGDTPADYWADQGVFAYYDRHDRLEAIEFAAPAQPKLDGNSLTDMSMEAALLFLKSLDPNVSVREDGTSLHSSQLGIGVWCPTADEGESMVDSVLVAGDGYFN
jgi:hypothetical protein